MILESIEAQAPDFGPTNPVYPELPQLCRVGPSSTSSSSSSSSSLTPLSANVYRGFVQQWTPPLSTRDREPCYVTEPNGVALGNQIYDCRLVGVYPTPGDPAYGLVPQLPLYATTCCVAAGSSSSFSSFSSH